MSAITNAKNMGSQEWFALTPEATTACIVALAALTALTIALSSWANVNVAQMHGTSAIMQHSPYTIALPIVLIGVFGFCARYLIIQKFILETTTPTPLAAQTPFTHYNGFEGMCTQIHVSSGDQVQLGDRICTLEAMKMAILILAEKAGTITELPISKNQLVEAGAPLYSIQ
jgi:Biotin-requiring enzyme